MKLFLNIIKAIVVIGLICGIVFFMITDLVFADDEIDFKDYYSSNIILDKDKDKGKWIVADAEKGEMFILNECNNELYVSAKNGLNIRSVPTINSIPLDTLTYGEAVSVVGEQTENNNMWALIEYNDNFGFVWSEYLTNDRPILNPSISKYDDSQNGEDLDYPDMTYLGNYMCTAYAWTGERCANGNYPTEGYTVACAPNTLPFGTKIYIDGYGYYVVEDRGGGGDYWIDIYMGDESTCNNFGVRYLDIYIVN